MCNFNVDVLTVFPEAIYILRTGYGAPPQTHPFGALALGASLGTSRVPSVPSVHRQGRVVPFLADE